MLNTRRCSMALCSIRVCDLSNVVRMTLLFLATVTILSVQTLADDPMCSFPFQPNGHPRISLLKPLMGKRFTVVDRPSDDKGVHQYHYDIGICTPAATELGLQYAKAGIVQTDMSTKKTFFIGNFTEAELKAGTDWAMLEYREGQSYGHHCSGGKRKGVIMIVCDPLVFTIEDVNPKLIIEENNKTKECYYLFELSHSCVCNYTKKAAITFSLSVGSIFVIVFVALCGVYLLGGLAYNRFVLGAKGMEQMPNYNFWLDFGNLQADGCNLVCRTGGRSEARAYKGIGDDQLGDADDDRDDHLLPM